MNAEQKEEAIKERFKVYQQRKKLEGLGGWLTYIGFVVIFSPIILIRDIGYIYTPVVRNWGTLDLALQHIIMVETIISVLIALMWCKVIHLFFTKAYKFPLYFVGLLLFGVGYTVLDAFVVSIYSGNPMFNEVEGLKFIQLIVKSTILISYITLSDRVNNTFLKHKS